MLGQHAMRLALISVALTLLLLTTVAGQRRTTPSVAGASNAGVRADSGRDGSMSLVRGAMFRMGTDPSDVPRLQQVFGIKRAEIFAEEAPQHTVTLSPFYMDRYEVTNALFKKFLDRNPRWRRSNIEARLHNGNYLKHWDGDDYPKDKAEHPVTNVSWYAAVAYCRWAGKRLPTEAEWEYAARGGLSDKSFPWGDAPADPALANYGASGIGTTTPVGSYAANPYGLFDMAGNVWEYTLDEWGPYNSSAQVNPVAGGSLFSDDSFYSVNTRRVIRGGSYGGAPVNLRVAYRDSHPPDGARDFVGFRCARPAPPGKSRQKD